MAFFYVPVAVPVGFVMAKWICAAIGMFVLASMFREKAARVVRAAGVAMMMTPFALYLSVWLPSCADVPWYIACWPF